MEDLLSLACTEIALEGREGCTVATLWERLGDRLPCASVTQLTPTVKQCLWRCLCDNNADVQLYKQQAAVKDKPSSSKAKSDTTQLVLEDGPAAQPYDTADSAGLVLKASDRLRQSVLGVYDAQECSYQLSDLMLRSLELIARGRYQGMLQSDLATQVKVPPCNFFYIVKCLEERGLVVRNPAMAYVPLPAGRKPSNSKVNQHHVTNILHLQPFAPRVKLRPHQVFKMAQHPAQHAQQLQAAVFELHDDSVLLRTVCSALAATEEKVAVEADLKVLLGMTKTKGHRLWRRLKTKLQKLGYIQVFLGRAGDRPIQFVKLLKDYTGEEESKDDDDDSGEGEGPGGEEGSNCMAELSLGRQILNHIVQAGTEGTTAVDIFAHLGLNKKAYAPLLDLVAERCGIRKRAENIGRTIFMRYFAPDHLLGQGEAPAAQLQGVEQLGAAPDSQPSELASTSAAPAQEASQGKGAKAAASGPPGASTSAAHRDGEEQAGGGKRQKASKIAGNGVEAPVSPAPAMAQAGAGDTGPAGPDAIGKTLQRALQLAGGGRKPHHKQDKDAMPKKERGGQTLLMNRRLEHLSKLLQERRFLVRFEMRQIISEFEREAGFIPADKLATHTGPETKALERILNAMEARQLGKRVTTALPGMKSGGDTVLLEAVVRPDVEVTKELITEIQEYLIKINRHMRSKAQIKFFAERAAQRGETLPEVEKFARLLPEGSGAGRSRLPGDGLEQVPASNQSRVLASQQHMQLLNNGFIMAKLIRARQLHYIICRLIGLAGYERGPSSATSSAPGGMPIWSLPVPGAYHISKMADLPKFNFNIHQSPQMPEQQPKSQQAASALPPPATAATAPSASTAVPSQKRSFTVRQLWDFLPLSLALQVVGTSNVVPNLAQLVDENKVISDYTEQQQVMIFDKQATFRLSNVLDLLMRMGLLHTLAAQGHSDVLIGSFCANETAVLDVPVQAPEADGEVAGSSIAPEAAATPTIRRTQFDLTSGLTGLDEYWSLLEYTYTSRNVALTELHRCFPGSDAPELFSRTAWTSVRLMEVRQWLTLNERMKAECTTINSTRCQQIAKELGVEYNQVLRISYDARKRGRLEALSEQGGEVLVPGGAPGHVDARALAERRADWARQRLHTARKQSAAAKRESRQPELEAMRQAQTASRLSRMDSQRKLREEKQQAKLMSKLQRGGQRKRRRTPAGDAEGQAKAPKPVSPFDWSQPARKHRASKRQRTAAGEASGAEAGPSGSAAARSSSPKAKPSAGSAAWRSSSRRRRASATPARIWTQLEDLQLLVTMANQRMAQEEVSWSALQPALPATIRACQQRTHFMTRKRRELFEAMMSQLDEVRKLSLPRLLLAGFPVHQRTAAPPGRSASDVALPELEVDATTTTLHVKEGPLRLPAEEVACVERLGAAVEALVQALPRHKLLRPGARFGQLSGKGLTLQPERMAQSALLRTGVMRSGYEPLAIGQQARLALDHLHTQPSQTALRIKPAVVAAMDLILSMLHAAHITGQLDTRGPAALAKRFEQHEAAAAVVTLRRLGWITEGTARRPPTLSSAFLSRLRAFELPAQLFGCARQTEKLLRKAVGQAELPATAPHPLIAPATDFPAAQATEMEQLVVNTADRSLLLPAEMAVPSGVLACVLERMAAGSVQLRWADAAGEGLDALLRSTAALPVAAVTVELVTAAVPDHSGATSPSSSAVPVAQSDWPFSATSGSRGRKRMRCEPGSEELLQQLEDNEWRLEEPPRKRPCGEAAQCATEGAVAAEVAAQLALPLPAATSLVEQVLAAVRAASDSGVTTEELLEGLGAGDAQPAVAGSAQKQRAGMRPLMRLLCQHGLTRSLSTYGGLSYVAAEHADRLLLPAAPTADTTAPTASDAAAPAATSPMAVDTASGAAAGEQQASGSKPAPARVTAGAEDRRAREQAADGEGSSDAGEGLRGAEMAGSGRAEGEALPLLWLDQDGRTNHALLCSLASRALSLVLRNPGVPEAVLVGHLDVLGPQGARELLALMRGAGCLEARAVTACAARRPALFGRSGVTKELVPQVHYFAMLPDAFDKLADIHMK